MIIAFAVLLGLAVGSFLNVVIWRVPRGESVVSPPSACPACDHEIRWYDNIPLVSWLYLQRRCRDCRTPISARYPAVELATAVVFGLCAARFGLSWSLLAYLYLAAIAVALTMIDLDTHRLPNAIVLPAYPVTAILLAVASWAESDVHALVRAALGALILFVAYLLMALAYPGGMGLGDVKLAGVLGAYLAWLGWGTLAVGSFAAFLIGGLFAIGLLMVGKATRKSGIPFGPWMLAGAAVGIACGEQLWSAYLETFI